MCCVQQEIDFERENVKRYIKYLEQKLKEIEVEAIEPPANEIHQPNGQPPIEMANACPKVVRVDDRIIHGNCTLKQSRAQSSDRYVCMHPQCITARVVKNSRDEEVLVIKKFKPRRAYNIATLPTVQIVNKEAKHA